MRVQDTSGSLRLNAIAGTHVVVDMDQADCRSLLGFSVNRTSHDEGESGYLTPA
ncbi:hypothetical protein I6F07_17520 [Ensifer sp. IC4062]|nr:hypothetical protein [Ensifer sp. IC4062]MCA1441981.1 hypothetical protein [Ensifer sp. IC4062]